MSEVTVVLGELEGHIAQVQQISGMIDDVGDAAGQVVTDMFGPLIGSLVAPVLDAFCGQAASVVQSATGMLDGCAETISTVKQNYEEAEETASRAMADLDAMLEVLST